MTARLKRDPLPWGLFAGFGAVAVGLSIVATGLSMMSRGC